MSVMLLSLNHYKQVYNKACCYQYNNCVDINYCETLHSYCEGRVKNLIKSLYELNYKSYCERYEDKYYTSEIEEAYKEIDSWNYNTLPKSCNTYQMLKLLECINYNIEIAEPTDEDSLNIRTLQRIISDIRNQIIEQIEEYKNAKWAID